MVSPRKTSRRSSPGSMRAVVVRAVISTESGVGGTAEATEDLTSDRVVPVAETIANCAWACGPGAASQDLVLASEERLRVLPVRKALESRIASEIGGGPLPDVADHSIAAARRNISAIRTHRRGVERQLVDVRVRACWRLITPRVQQSAGGSIP